MGDLSFKGFNDDGSVEIGYGIDEAHQGQGYATEAVGFDIDVAKVVCDRLGVTLVTQGIDWNEKEDRLNSGEIDCIWNGLSVTPAAWPNMQGKSADAMAILRNSRMKFT